MNPTGSPPTFRLLDAYTGWDFASDVSAMVDPNDPVGLRLRPIIADSVSEADLLAFLPPRWLATGCGPCERYLLTESPHSLSSIPPMQMNSQILRLDRCGNSWQPVWQKSCEPEPILQGVAIASRRRRIAVADGATNTIRVWDYGGTRLVASMGLVDVCAIALSLGGDLFAGVKGRRIVGFDPIGQARGNSRQLPANAVGEIDRIATDSSGCLWVVLIFTTGNQVGYTLYQEDETHQFNLVPAAQVRDRLSAALAPTGLIAADHSCFCFERVDDIGRTSRRCFTRKGAAASAAPALPSPMARVKTAELNTVALDSGISRCRWHRVRIDADVPKGCQVQLSLVTIETAVKPDPTAGTSTFGLVDADWQLAPAGATDFLIDQPPGRFLAIRLRLTGDGVSTPTVRRIRLDFPRVTSLDYLPAVYREDPVAEDFTERFLALFDGSIADIDKALAAYPAMLDPASAPEELLPWLGQMLGVVMAPDWSAQRRRTILLALPALYRQRGTLAGLQTALRLLFDIEVVIQELYTERNWAALPDLDCAPVATAWNGRQRLGETTLYSQSQARFQLGSSVLGQTPIKGYGDPNLDPLAAQAFRFRVLIPPSPDGMDSGKFTAAVKAAIDAQKPAHTVATIVLGGGLFGLAMSPRIGMNTALRGFPAPILGSIENNGGGGNVRLSRGSVLWHGSRGTELGIVLDDPTMAIGGSIVMR